MSPKALESWQKPEWETFTVDEGGVVVVAGRQVPHLRCHRIVSEFEGFRFCLGNAGTLDCDIDDAPHVAAILAAALAVGAGYVGWPDEGNEFVKRPFAPVVHGIDFGDGNE